MSNFLPFALPDIGEEEISEVVDSLRSGWLTTGPKTARFEQGFAQFIGNDVTAIAVNSATAGLHLALEALGIGHGDQVITTPYTFTATAAVIEHLGGEPVFADIDPSTFNIDPKKIESLITRRTKAILPVHIAGLSCDMSPIIEIARKHDLKIVEDGAHALPSTYKNQLIGSLDTDATVFSFYATKTLATGEGGMLVTRNENIARRCRVMRLHGIDRDAFSRYYSSKPAWYYEIVAPGFKYNMTDIAASIGIHQLQKQWSFQRKRSQIAAAYNDAFKDLPLILPPHPTDGDIHSWHLYIIRLDSSVNIERDRLIQMLADRGIGTSVHFIPLHLHPYWRDRYGLTPNSFPNATLAYERSLSLPIYTKMTDSDVNRVISDIRDIF